MHHQRRRCDRHIIIITRAFSPNQLGLADEKEKLTVSRSNEYKIFWFAINPLYTTRTPVQCV